MSCEGSMAAAAVRGARGARPGRPVMASVTPCAGGGRAQGLADASHLGLDGGGGGLVGAAEGPQLLELDPGAPAVHVRRVTHGDSWSCTDNRECS
jgi:hypothetical protein